MSWAFVQATSNSDESGTTDGSISQAFGSNNAAGNLIIVSGSYYDPSDSVTATCSDSRNTYVSLVGHYRAGTGTSTHQYGYVFAAYNIGAGANTPKITYSSSVAYVDIEIHEYSGLATSSAYDVQGLNNTDTGTAMSTGSATPNFNNELAFGYFYAYAGSNTFSAFGTGINSRTINVGGDRFATCDKLVSSGSSTSLTCTYGGNCTHDFGIMVTFQLPGAAAAAPGGLTLRGCGL